MFYKVKLFFFRIKPICGFLIFRLKKLYSTTVVLSKLKNRYKFQTFYILGAGPSLIDFNLEKLSNKNIILTNSTYKLREQIISSNVYHYMQDDERIIEMNQFISADSFNYIFRSISYLPVDFNTYEKLVTKEQVFLPPKIGLFKNGFFKPHIKLAQTDISNVDLFKYVTISSSVIFGAIQLAIHMGARKIILLGVDMNYSKHTTNNHFDSSSISFQRNLNLTEDWYLKYMRPTFVSYKKLCNQLGVNLLNATINTKEDVLEKTKV
jgi:hypothetical protein